MSDTPSAAPAAPLGDLFAATAKGSASRSFNWSEKARPLDGIHGWFRTVLFAHIGAQALSALILVVMLWLFASLMNGEDFSEAQATVLAAFGTFAQLLPFAVIGAQLACIICYLLFVHRATTNLHVSNARGMSVSPGWAVGYSFIPFVNLVMIYRVMKEIWEASADPDRGRHSAPQLLGWWWGLYLGGNFLGRISEMFVPADAEFADMTEFFDAFLPGSIVGIISATAAIASTLCLMTIIRQIKDAQETLRATSAFEE